jgi:hypothetical protein
MSDGLRAALLDLGDVPPPPDLAGAALGRARRNRRRSITGLIALVAILAAAAVTVPTVVLRRTAAPRTAVERTQPITGFMVTAYTTIADPYNGKIPKVSSGPQVRYPPTVYSPSQGRYVTPPWRTVLPSPDGRLVAVSNAGQAPGSDNDAVKPGPVGFVPADRIDDPTAVRWVSGVETSGQFLSWEADSRHLVVQAAGLQLVDARTLATRSLNFAIERNALRESLPVVPPDGRGFALTVIPPGFEGGVTQWSLQYYDDRGERIRDVLIVGTSDLPTRVAQPFSPDGSLVALAAGDRTDIVDTSSGRIVLRATDGVFAQWYDDEHFIVWGGVSTGRRLVRLVELRTGRVVAGKVVAPAGRMLTGLWLAPVHGDAPPGPIVVKPEA